MSDEELKARYQRWMGQASRTTGTTSAPPTVEQIADLVAGKGTEAERLALLDLVMSDPALEREYALLAATHDAGRQLSRAPSRRPIQYAIAATIAAALIGGALFWRAQAPAADLVRGSNAVTLISPDDGNAASTLVWHRDHHADDYIVELLGVAGDSLMSVATADTVLALDAVPSSQAAASWRVIARRSDGTSAMSPVRRFQRTAP